MKIGRLVQNWKGKYKNTRVHTGNMVVLDLPPFPKGTEYINKNQ
jgi:hypothetical protein